MEALSRSRDRGEAEWAGAILPTQVGWISLRIAEAFGVCEDTVRFWRSAFMAGGVAALRTSVAPGPAPVKVACALAVAEEPLSEPVADHPIGRCCAWRTRSRRAPAYASRARACRSCRAKGGFPLAPRRHTLKARQDPDGVDRVGLRCQLMKAQAEAGDIVLLFGDESEALTHPYLAHVWARRGADPRIPAPGYAATLALLGVLDWARPELIVRASRTKRSTDFIALVETLDRRYGLELGRCTKPVRLVVDNGPIHTSKVTTAALAQRAHWLRVE